MVNKIKVMTVFGTRPEANKMCPLVLKLRENDVIEETTVVTAQHREMLDQSLEAFGVKPHFDLDIMQKNQTLTDITCKALTGVGKIISDVEPDLVLVHGDTTTSFAAGLAAFYHKVKVGHVEAGLRTCNKLEPYPEEVNRRLTAVLADLNFSPTRLSKENLIKEGFSSIYVTGNTAIDGLRTTVKEDYSFDCKALNQIDFKHKRVIVMTAHRRENFGEPMKNIFLAVKKIVESFDDVEVIYPVHPNPVVLETVNSILQGVKGVHLIKPLGITDMHNLMNKSYFVMTDSGGLQEEAPHMGKPVLVLRNVTERPEGVTAGTLKLAGVDYDNICKNANILLTDKAEYNKMSVAKNPFGDGRASERIVDAILHYFGLSSKKTDEFEF